jgi:hypothetical protein
MYCFVGDIGPVAKAAFNRSPTALCHQSVYPTTGGWVADAIVEEFSMLISTGPLDTEYLPVRAEIGNGEISRSPASHDWRIVTRRHPRRRR